MSVIKEYMLILLFFVLSNIYILLKYSWLNNVSSAQQSDSVIHINTHIYSFFRFFFIIVYYKIRVQFPMLYSRSLLAICFIQSSESCRSLIREWWILVFLTAGWSLRSTHLKVSWKRHIWGWKNSSKDKKKKAVFLRPSMYLFSGISSHFLHSNMELWAHYPVCQFLLSAW